MYIGDDVNGRPVRIGDMCKVVHVNDPRTGYRVGQAVLVLDRFADNVAVIKRDSDGDPEILADTDRDLARMGPDFYFKKGANTEALTGSPS